MPTTVTAPTTRTPLRRRAALLGAGALAATALLGTADARALVVSSDANGLQMREPDNILDRVKLSLVDVGGLKYRVEMAQFGGRGIGFGPGCTQISTQHGLDIALCERINPVVSQVTFGPMRDTLEVDPAFPDPIHVADGGIGPDIFTLGAGADVSRADRLDTIFGQGGDDQLTSFGGRVDGGEGNDRLHAAATIAGPLVGGPGDDALTAEADSVMTMIGGEGTDSFDAGGARGVIDSRDGIPEPVTCGGPAGRGAVAVVDLLDTPDDAALIAGGCRSVDRAPRQEKTAAQLASRALTVRRGTAAVKIRCTTAARCSGTVALRAGGRTSGKRFAIAGKRTGSVRLAARTGAVTVRVAEAGIRGPRTLLVPLRATR
jgi:hypothetical protein